MDWLGFEFADLNRHVMCKTEISVIQQLHRENPSESANGCIADFARHHRRHLTEHGKIVRLIVAPAIAAAVAVVIASFCP